LIQKTPYELWRNRKPNISCSHPFGVQCFILNNKDSLGNFDSKSDEGMLLGYSELSKAYRVYNSRISLVEETIHVRFNNFKPDKTLSE